MDANQSTTNWIIAGLVALAVLIGGGWLVARERAGNMVTATASSTGALAAAVTDDTKKDTTAIVSTPADPLKPTPTSVASGETITALDQPAGAYVVVADVKLAKPSWVVIRGTNGRALGAAWFNESTKSFVVPLMKPTVAGETYQAVIYVDDGDKTFTLHAADTLVTDTEGAPVSSTFKTK